jgi:hypothetical protein
MQSALRGIPRDLAESSRELIDYRLIVTTAKGMSKQLEQAIEKNQEVELDKNKNQIKKLIQEDLITRYQYREGLYQFYVKENLEIEKAILLLNNQTQYKSILKK